uniref:Ubiquitin-like protease family profile domain-containing protein n=1 Tax=Lactuca sativa TaxID=4236 RepID=A0A9R1VGL4_LACSA|nr:hypothetical protein LSAT_V11C500264070 [Lactuca sativa]
MKKHAFEVIDNGADNTDFDDKYGAVFKPLVKINHVKANEMDDKNITTVRLIMPWRTVYNKLDCGIFAMRHMEIYFGEKGSKWKCGLPKEGVSQERILEKLRMKYAATILTSEINTKHDDVLKVAYEYQKVDQKIHGKHVDDAQWNIE